MNKAVFTIIAAISIFSAEPMYGADQRLAFSHKGYRDCHDVWRCGPIGCRATLVCARACPDRYSCYSALREPMGPTAVRSDIWLLTYILSLVTLKQTTQRDVRT